MNHTYRNFSDTARDESYTLPTDVTEMTFHEKLYHILSSSRDIYREAIKWSSHGRAFEIVDTAKLSKFGILRTYFGSNIVPQFRKQLHNHGYKQLTTNVGGMEAYYSEVSCVCRGNRSGALTATPFQVPITWPTASLTAKSRAYRLPNSTSRSSQ